MLPENKDFVVAIDDGFTVLPRRVGASFRGRLTPGCGAMSPPWSPMEQQIEASKHFDQPGVQNDNEGSRRRKRDWEKS